MKPARVLLVEDDESLAASLADVLAQEDYQVECVGRGDDGVRRAREEDFDVVLTDLRLPGADGLELVKEIHAERIHLPIILMTAHGTAHTAIEATKFGAFDYILKPFEMDDLLAMLAHAVRSSRLANLTVDLGTAASGHDGMIGRSRRMQEVFKEIGRIAPQPVTVLLRGETGTGKELVARAIVQHSDRARRPFIAVNCAAIPETLLESELFGHERGAFTGADGRRIGRFEQAQGGTIFLDEVGEMSPGTQAKLLRVLQERCIQRLGGRESIPVDIRVIAATHRDLQGAIADKQFREDLYYRLNVVTLTLPPLRDHPDDIPLLCEYFLERYAREQGKKAPHIQEEAVKHLMRHPWPGNVRQLENVLRQCLVAARGYPITSEHVRQALSGQQALSPDSTRQHIRDFVTPVILAASRGEKDDALASLVDALECEACTIAFDLANGNQAKAARWLGISRLTMREKLRKYGMRAPR